MNLIQQLDHHFRIAIRHRDLGNNSGAMCFTCCKWTPAHALQVGHFVGRTHNKLRWDFVNCHLQCNHCNVVRHGNLDAYEKALDAKYGNGTAEMLKLESRFTFKMTKPEKQELLLKLKERNKQNKRLIDLL